LKHLNIFIFFFIFCISCYFLPSAWTCWKHCINTASKIWNTSRSWYTCTSKCNKMLWLFN